MPKRTVFLYIVEDNTTHPPTHTQKTVIFPWCNLPLTSIKMSCLFPDFCLVWNFFHLSLTTGHRDYDVIRFELMISLAATWRLARHVTWCWPFQQFHDDVIPFKRLPHYCPLVRGFIGRISCKGPATRSFDVSDINLKEVLKTISFDLRHHNVHVTSL